MKFFKYLIVFLFAFTSCKSLKTSADANSKLTSVKKISKKHIAAGFDKETVDARLKVNFENPKEKVDFSVRLKMKKDEVIWMKGTKFITVFKAKITPEKVSFYSPYKKNYIEGDFDTLKEILGFEIGFYQLQNLLLGQTLYNLNDSKHIVAAVEPSYILQPKIQPDLFDIFYNISQKHFKLNEQSLVNKSKAQDLTIAYPAYKTIDNTLFPEKINISATQKTKQSKIGISVRSVIFDEAIEIPYKIPSSYQEIKL